jgi:hypothetical protein
MAHTFLHGGEIPGINVNIKMSGHLAHFSFRNSTVAVKLKIANIFFVSKKWANFLRSQHWLLHWRALQAF